MTIDPIHGLIIIDKPLGITSHAVVQRVKKILHVSKAGHTGTLDPNASGVLPVCLNEGTKLSPFLTDSEKEYEGTLRLGMETDTQDGTGRVIRELHPIAVTESDIEAAFRDFQGTIKQIPPMYSAIKHKGVPLYRLARQGKYVERVERSVEIRELSILRIALPDITFRVVCSKGTYVRTLVNDIGRSLGSCAYLEKLRRTRSGNFLLERAVTLSMLQDASLEEIKRRWVISLSAALSSLPSVTIDDDLCQKVRRGQTVTVEEFHQKAPQIALRKGTVKVVDLGNQLVAIARIKNTDFATDESHKGNPLWNLLRVFNAE
ncbi:MAG: tRNA pseudouridine(55) synthase TruB [Deltaproteobacteria bacterium]|nr:tRNA pseudouridine(55) synthase TruB [Deltaproteobacteria bacterium]